jgi:hypothetical protein
VAGSGCWERESDREKKRARERGWLKVGVGRESDSVRKRERMAESGCWKRERDREREREGGRKRERGRMAESES